MLFFMNKKDERKKAHNNIYIYKWTLITMSAFVPKDVAIKINLLR